jgi:hypothetical protein
MRKKCLIEWTKIASSIFLGVMLLVTVITIINYSQEVKEVLGGKDPDRLMQKYEEETNTKCLCANPEYGYVTYIPLLSK